ncbi:uncharacterized protein [Panulirus ornatus]
MVPPVTWVLLGSILVLIALISTASALCEFPAEWTGRWFRSGVGQQEPIVITRSSISKTGECIEKGKASRYLVKVKEEKYNCHMCMVINMKHINVIQYKESYCDDTMEMDLRSLCMDITGDAMLFSMFRLGSEPVPCPFHGPLTFTYSRGYGECLQPVSQVDSCAEDSRLLFRHQACADVPGSESFVEELVCLGSWKEGSNHYLVGKVDHIHANSDEDRYRCFIYEHPHHQGNTQTWNLAQSADATCQGLISAHEGSKTMKLTKVTHNGRKCKFPSWLTVHRHWHTLDNSQSYFVYHKNTSLRISNGTAAPEDIETRGHTDLRLVCHKYESHHEHHEHRRPGDHHTANSDHHKHHHDHADDDHVTLVAHVTVGCKSGYQCMRLYRRDEHVVQVRSGELAFTAEEACSTHYWSPNSANLTTLVAAGGPPGPCGPFGRYHVPDTLVPCAGDAPTFTHVTVGCNSDSGNTLQLNARCPEESVFVFHCHGQWESEGVTYVVASPMSRASGAPRRVCFAYSVASSPGNANTPAHTLTLTARHDTCIQRQHDAHIALNATLAGQCMEVSNLGASSSKRLTASLLHLTLLLLFVPATISTL